MRNVIAALLICATAAPAVAQDISGAQQASQRFTSALSSGDAATAGSFLTDESVALPPGREMLNGRSQIQQFLGNMTHAVKDLKYTQDDIKPIGDSTAREVGTFSFQGRKQGSAPVTGKYLIVWTRAGSEWKVAADMWNRSGGGGGGGAGRKAAKPGGQTEAPDAE